MTSSLKDMYMCMSRKVKNMQMQTKLRNLEDEASSFESYVVQSRVRVFPSLRSKKRLKSSERGAKVREHVMVLLLLDNI